VAISITGNTLVGLLGRLHSITGGMRGVARSTWRVALNGETDPVSG
jgi:hypothetical protein